MDLRNAIGFGVAGNMTGHLEQAGEASDFVAVKTAEAAAPKGMFPFHVPGHTGQLGVFPLSSTALSLPEEEANVQIEPEVALLLDLDWDGEALVGLRPTAFAAYNDASIRKPAAKISVKKNWGPATKGVSDAWIAIDGLSEGGPLDGYHLACFLLRDGELFDYGEDSAVKGYSYFHEQLLGWMLDRLQHQEDHGPLEHLMTHLVTAGRPTRAVVSIGATRYTHIGETTFLKAGDHALVVVYDATRYRLDDIRARLLAGDDVGEGLSVLRQVVA
ncbi:MAG: hypothetical protein EP330_24090 [Deltaproteobacteria bacterium]|nr:MAG: hypothetical protein EP330_24090 [Deltaproteobacteria bacterium]